MRRIWCVVIVSALTTVGALAQEGLTFAGRTADEQGLALPGALVELRLPDGAFVTSAISNRRGEFTMSDVVPGEYRVITVLQGFQTDEQDVRLETGASGFAITLTIGGFRQEVSVSAVMPEVATELVVSAHAIERRPVRDVAAALRAESGVMRCAADQSTLSRRSGVSSRPRSECSWTERARSRPVRIEWTRTSAT